MEFLRKIGFVGLVALFVACSAFAQKLTVVTEEYPPYNFLNSDNKISGMATEVVEEVLIRAKVDYQLGI